MQKCFQCRSCEQVQPVSKWKQVDELFFCPECNKENFYEEWPDYPIRKVIQLIRSLSPLEPDYSRLASLLISPCLEDMMRTLLTTMAMKGTIWDEVSLIVPPLLDGYKGRVRQLLLFKRIGYGSFTENCKKLGFTNYPNQWAQISEQRNHYAHTADHPSRLISYEDVQIFLKDSLSVFSALHNKYNSETTAYSASITPPEETDRELRELLLEELEGNDPEIS